MCWEVCSISIHILCSGAPWFCPVAGVFEEDSGKFGQSCSMLVGLGCASVVVVVMGEVFWGAVHVWVHF